MLRQMRYMYDVYPVIIMLLYLEGDDSMLHLDFMSALSLSRCYLLVVIL